MKLKIIFNKIFVTVLSFALLAGCVENNPEIEQSSPNVQSEQVQSATRYEVDYFKISPMIKENAKKEVVDAALDVIDAFLNYENEVELSINENKSRFLNDLGYIVDCTCPLFSAFTNFSEMTSYSEEKNLLSWDYFVSQEQHKSIISDFTEIVNEYLSVIDKEDSDSMKAILLYYEMVHNATYDYDILGDAYETMEKKEYCLKNSSYNVLVNKSGICTNLSQALTFLYTQADLKSGTVLHQGGSGSHMWSIVEIDGKYYYCDPTWDVGTGPNTFGITANDRNSWAGEYSKEEGSMLGVTIPKAYDIDDDRFAILREKIPVEITKVKTDKEKQSITFIGYDYEYTFNCTQ